MMVSLLKVQLVQVVGGIIDWPPCGGDEETFLSLYVIPLAPLGGQELWPHLGEVNTKPLLAEEK